MGEKNEDLKARIVELEKTLSAEAKDNRYRDLFEASADANLIIDGDTFIDCNAATVEMLGYNSKEELLQTHPSQLSPEYQEDGRLSFEKANEILALAMEKGSHRFEWLHKKADGEIFPVEVLLTAVSLGNRKILHTVWRDITERKRLETELRQAQKMEAIGKLAGGIAHDFNNLLMAIIGNTEMMKDDCEPGSENEIFLGEILRASQRAADLVKQLLIYSRKQILNPSIMDLGSIFRNLDQILGRLLGEDINIVLKMAPHPLPVLVDPGQLEQVILNLATNARDAMVHGGTLTFSTSRIDIEKNGLDKDNTPSPGTYSVLSVQDTGVGISPKSLGRIFDPFYTTKEIGRGTGLGLSTVYGIVKQSGGEITVASEEGKGTLFRIYLPLQENYSAQPETETPSEVESLTGNESLLVVEDEPAILRLIKRIFQDRGYEVHTAKNGREALDFVESGKVVPDLIITDVIMPVMGGSELVNRLRNIYPDMRVLFISGYTNSVLLKEGVIKGDVDMVTKPFRSQDISVKVREILDRD